VIIAVLPWFALAVLPVLCLCFKVQKFYRPASRDLQRLESLSRSPIFAHFSETLNGVATLRALNKQAQWVQVYAARIDARNKAYYYLQVSDTTIYSACMRAPLQCMLLFAVYSF
jgi:ABC-type multidrug transport system fused ATPase/permease subunit